MFKCDKEELVAFDDRGDVSGLSVLCRPHVPQPIGLFGVYRAHIETAAAVTFFYSFLTDAASEYLPQVLHVEVLWNLFLEYGLPSKWAELSVGGNAGLCANKHSGATKIIVGGGWCCRNRWR